MQKNLRLLPFAALVLATTFTACKKDATPDQQTNEMATHADDQNRVSTQIDAVSNEVSFAVESSAAFSGGKMMNPPVIICDASVSFDSTSNPRTITIAYDGSNPCGASFTRTGTVVVSMPANMQWKDQGATITLNYENLKVTRVSDHKSITLNGSHTITNVSGGLLFNLASIPSVTHVVSSPGMNITFDDNTQRTWQVATRRVFTYNNGIVLSVTGNNSIGNIEGIAEWGVNRFGKDFTTTITQPLVFRQDCAFRLTSGEVKHEGFGTATATFGLDANGNPTSCPGTGHFYFKLTWQGPNGGTATTILPY